MRGARLIQLTFLLAFALPFLFDSWRKCHG